MIGQEAHGRRMIRCQRNGEVTGLDSAREMKGGVRCPSCYALEPGCANN